MSKAADVRAAIQLRETVTEQDPEAVREIVSSTGFFHAPEVDVAVELVQERLARGPASGYFFVFADLRGRTIGYTCYGPIACTIGSYDLFWIAVLEEYRNHGLGRMLLEATEQRIAAVAGARRIYIETSGRALYVPTQHFYTRCGYVQEAVLTDFYAPGDPKIVYSKALPTPPA
ncbi:MAG: GNAT family N-acetyltransferase [Phycisphaerae bacterium]|nr:GNAT family N-acetyltransferase [Phycisphaerae bacterium]